MLNSKDKMILNKKSYKEVKRSIGTVVDNMDKYFVIPHRVPKWKKTESLNELIVKKYK
jgi:hypothetical protein